MMGAKAKRRSFPRIDAIVKSISHKDDWYRSTQQSETYLYQLRATINLGIFEPFTPEQKALSDYLAARRADKRLCDYAWRLYAQSVT